MIDYVFRGRLKALVVYGKEFKYHGDLLTVVRNEAKQPLRKRENVNIRDILFSIKCKVHLLRHVLVIAFLLIIGCSGVLTPVLCLQGFQCISSYGMVEYVKSSCVWIYEFEKYTIFAPWWRVRLGSNASLRLTSNGLTISGGWGTLDLHETVGNYSVMLECGNWSVNYGVGFVGVDGSMWRVSWYAYKIQFVSADNIYGKNAISYTLFNLKERPLKLGVEYVNSSVIRYYFQCPNSSIMDGLYMTPKSLSQPRYAELFLNGEGYFSRLYVAEKLDDILNSPLRIIVEDKDWYPTLEITVSHEHLLLGVHAAIVTNKLIGGWIKFTEDNIDRDLNFLRKYQFNAIRLSLDWEGLMPSIGQFNLTVLNWIRNFTSYANSNGFHVILFMGSYSLSYILSTNSTWEENDEWLNYLMGNATLRNTLIQTWYNIARYVRDFDVSYELLNEPDAGESGGETGFLNQAKLFEEIGETIRLIDPIHTIYIPTYQWQDKHYLWAAKNIKFNFTNYGFSLHVYPTKDNIDNPNFGYNDAFISWLKNNQFPIIVTETVLTALDPWINENVLPNPYTWSEAWNKTISFICGFQKLKGIIFLVNMITLNAGAYSKPDILYNQFEVFHKQCTNIFV